MLTCALQRTADVAQVVQQAQMCAVCQRSEASITVIPDSRVEMQAACCMPCSRRQDEACSRLALSNIYLAYKTCC